MRPCPAWRGAEARCGRRRRCGGGAPAVDGRGAGAVRAPAAGGASSGRPGGRPGAPGPPARVFPATASRAPRTSRGIARATSTSPTASRHDRQRARRQVRQGRPLHQVVGLPRQRAGAVQLAARHRARRAGQRLRRRRGQQAHPGVRRRRQPEERRLPTSARHPRSASRPGRISISTARTPTIRRRSTTARSTSWSSTARSSASSARPAGCRRSSAPSTRSTAAARTSCWSAKLMQLARAEADVEVAIGRHVRAGRPSGPPTAGLNGALPELVGRPFHPSTTLGVP